jgi:hypothetical protein
MHPALKLATAILLIGVAAPVMAVDDGPRAYFPLPAGTNNFNVIGLFQNGNSSIDPATAVKGAKVNIDVGVLQYSRTFDIGGKSAGIVVLAPMGEVRARLATAWSAKPRAAALAMSASPPSSALPARRR